MLLDFIKALFDTSEKLQTCPGTYRCQVNAFRANNIIIYCGQDGSGPYMLQQTAVILQHSSEY